MILEILFIVAMFLWFLSAMGNWWPPMQQFYPASWLLAFICVLILGIEIFWGNGHMAVR